MSLCAGEVSAVMSAADRVKPDAHLADMSMCAGEVSACHCVQVKCQHVDVCR